MAIKPTSLRRAPMGKLGALGALAVKKSQPLPSTTKVSASPPDISGCT